MVGTAVVCRVSSTAASASRAHLRAGLPASVDAVLQGMVLGDDENVDPQAVSDFRRSGLLHILAVSGENVVLLCGICSAALALFGVPRLARTLALLPLVVAYVLLTGASPSIVRAGVAGVIGLLAVLASRPADGWLLWLAPAAWLLTVNPNDLYDVSFQLSFGAVLGLLLLARPIAHGLRLLPKPLSEQIGVTTAASLATAPISMLTFGSASLVAVPANVAGVRAGAHHAARPAVAAGRLREPLAVHAAERAGRPSHRLPAHRGALLRASLLGRCTSGRERACTCCSSGRWRLRLGCCWRWRAGKG